MKKITALIILTAMLFSLAACGNEKTSSTPTSQTVSADNESASSEKTDVADKSVEKTDKSQSKQPAQSSSVKPSKAQSSASHTHKYTAVKTPATCKQQGYTTYTCSCGDSYKDSYVNGKHEYVNNKCKYCGKADIDGLYTYLKNWVISNGTVNGDYVAYSVTSDTYGGYNTENFNFTYWNDSGKLEFCLHCPLDATYSHAFYIYIPKSYNGNYEYISSYYYRDNGESKYESTGVIEASVFTKNYPLKSSNYYGSAERQNSFLEESREGICDLLDCIGQFLKKQNTGYTLSDLGFNKFS